MNDPDVHHVLHNMVSKPDLRLIVEASGTFMTIMAMYTAFVMHSFFYASVIYAMGFLYCTIPSRWETYSMTMSTDVTPERAQYVCRNVIVDKVCVSNVYIMYVSLTLRHIFDQDHPDISWVHMVTLMLAYVCGLRMRCL
ncbi:MAG: hypothetical protein CMK92_03615 [Pseudomonas sp.]|nr:hypothetical protein [Pseudomonas sp.]